MGKYSSHFVQVRWPVNISLADCSVIAKFKFPLHVGQFKMSSRLFFTHTLPVY